MWKLTPVFLCVLFLTVFAFDAIAGDNVTAANDTLKVMTWNVKLLPRHLVFIHHHPVKRAKYIAEQVLSENVDVVVFQEAFDHRALNIITKNLKKTMPYSAGHLKGHIIVKKCTGGVVMYSKYPVDLTATTRYLQCSGVDCMGRKGAVLAEIVKNSKKIQIVGTHIQAGGTHEIKLSQYKQMGELAEKYSTAGVPQLLCGDFNTKSTDTTLYPKLVTTLKATNGGFSGDLKYTSDHLLNDMDTYDPNKRRVIDYIFVKPNGVTPKSTVRYVRQFQHQWSKKHKDLSDHNAVIMDIVF